jgi:hypothetical protein
MPIKIRVGNEGFVDMPFVELDPGEGYTFFDHGQDPERADSARILTVHCNEDEPSGTLLIIPCAPELFGEIDEDNIPDDILKNAQIRRINNKPETVTINNPERGFKSARAVLRYAAQDED